MSEPWRALMSIGRPNKRNVGSSDYLAMTPSPLRPHKKTINWLTALHATRPIMLTVPVIR